MYYEHGLLKSHCDFGKGSIVYFGKHFLKHDIDPSDSTIKCLIYNKICSIFKEILSLFVHIY